ncbi:MAG: methyltransferase domain-containing protein [Acidimicrobiaceae bacterium]|nr:methyltransferase domain-containing protein [Acidimicrobiaceae bacterium]
MNGAATVWRVIGGLSDYWCLAAAVELEVVPHLTDGPATADELARSCGAEPGRMRALLGGLVAMELLRVSDGRYALCDAAAEVLIPGRPGYMGQLVLESPGPADNWPALARTTRGQPPPHPVEDDGGRFYRSLVTATFPVQYQAARAVTAELELDRRDAALRILDLGTGAAPWGAALLEAFPAARAVANDLPEVLPVAEEHLTRLGLVDRVELRGGDYMTVPLEPAGFDIAVLGHVCRAEGGEGAARLVARAAEALCAGGLLILADYPLDNDNSGPSQALRLGVTMMASTRRGAMFTVAEAERWLLDAGLGPAERTTPVPPTTVLLSRKERP